MQYLRLSSSVLAVIVATLFSTSHLFAQDIVQPDQGQVNPSDVQETSETIYTNDGFTIWKETVSTGCSYSDHNFSLDVSTDPQFMSDISYQMTNLDVDYNDPQGCEGGPEVDHMKFNGRFLGILTGANNSWSTNTWPLKKSDIISGSNALFIDTDAPGTGCWCVGVGYVQVKAKVGFQILNKTPQDNDKNRDFHKDKVDLTVTFSTEYDPATLNNTSFKLEYRDQGGSWQPIAGSFTRLAPEKFRFDAGADLKDGVRYRATVKSGDAGIKSKAGAKLNSDTSWYFWTVPDLSKNDQFNYGSGSSCPPATAPCPGLEIAVFQVARNVNMVPTKDAVARLYVRWLKHNDVLDADQVKTMDVDAKITVGGTSTSSNTTVKRPDQYSAAEKKSASNTLNIYHTPSSGFSYSAELTPKPQTNSTPVKYTQTLNLTSKGNSPSITFPYYFLKDGAWSAGVPAAAKTDGVNILNGGVLSVKDQFPVLNVSFNQLGDYTIGYTLTGTLIPFGNCGTVNQVTCPAFGGAASSNKAELLCAFERLSTLKNGAKFVAATVPNGLCVGATAFAVGSNVFMHQSGGGANFETVSHEIGHIYGISPANTPTNKHRNSSVGVEGFQVRTKTNRSNIENSAFAISLMHTTVQTQGTQWIHNGDYNALLGSVNLLSTFNSNVLNAATFFSNEYLVVAGYVNLSTNSGSLLYSFRQEQPNNAPLASGTCKAELLNAGGTSLVNDNFNLGIEIETFGATGSEVSASNLLANEPEEFFSVSLPWDDTARVLRITCNNVVVLTVERTSAAPTVDFAELDNGATLTGSPLLTWSATDVDSTNLSYQLQFSADSGTSWTPLIPLSGGTTYTLNTTLLPVGTGRLLRIMATDGMNSAYATRLITLTNSLTVLAVSPGVDVINAELTAPVDAIFASDLATPTITNDTFVVLRNGTASIEGTVKYNAGSRTLSFNPTTALEPNTNYSAAIYQSITDLAGNALDSVYTWNFTTITDTLAPYVKTTNPQDAELDVPLNLLIQAQFNERMNAATITTNTLRVQDSNGELVIGTVTYNDSLHAAILQPGLPLKSNMTYTAQVLTGVTDLNSNALANDYVWHFSTGSVTITNGLRIVGNYSDNAIDSSGDGLFDDLLIFVDVEVQEEDYYNLNGRLIDKNNELILWTTTGSILLEKGVHRLQLVFRSIPIRSNGISGPYVLDSLSFYRESISELPDERSRAYETFAYSVNDFFAILTLGGLPDQLLESGTTRDNAFNLRNFTTHATLPVAEVAYSLLINTDPNVGLSIDNQGNIDINPAAEVEAESDVSIEAKDSLGNRVVSFFHISVQKARLSVLAATPPATIGTNLSLPITVDVSDQFNRVYTRPVTITLETTYGTVEPALLTVNGGSNNFVFKAGNSPGPAFITMRSGELSKVLTLNIVEVAVASLAISGPSNGVVGTAYNFVADAGPVAATRPISFNWQATTLSPIQNSGDLSSTASFQWTKAGVQSVSVAAGNNAGSANSTHQITLSPGAPASTALTVTLISIRADGSSSTVVRVSVLDQFGNPIPGQSVSFSTSLGTIEPSATTNENGVASVKLTAGSQTGSALITATVDGITGQSSVELTNTGIYLPLISR